MEKKYLITNINPRTGKLETYDYRTGDLMGTEEGLTSKYVYTFALGQAICNLVREGKTIKWITQQDNMPAYSTVSNWRNLFPDFDAMMKQARRDRAEYYHDKAVEALEGAEGAGREELPAAKLQVEGFMKLAEKGNPEAFNPKQNVLQNANAPTMIVINTGINREPINIEVNNEKIRIDQRPEDGLRGVSERGEGGAIETESREVPGDPTTRRSDRRGPKKSGDEKEGKEKTK